MFSDSTGCATAAANPDGITLVRAQPLRDVSMTGKFADKDTTLDIESDDANPGKIKGTLAYLGRTVNVSGERRVTRSTLRLRDPSRSQTVGSGYVLWDPSSDRATDIRDRKSSVTDRLTIYFKFDDGLGIHKTLKRAL